MEISESLAAKQERRVCQVKTHRERYQVWGGRDAALAGSWGAVDTRPCYIVMLEVILHRYLVMLEVILHRIPDEL